MCTLATMATTVPRVPAVSEAPKAKNTTTNNKNKRTFMLHSGEDMTALGRFISTDWRYAALKAASRGHKKILLRQTGTREVREFEGNRIPIEPKQITRGGRTITYTNRPQVKYVKKFTYAGAIDDQANVVNNPVADAK